MIRGLFFKTVYGRVELCLLGPAVTPQLRVLVPSEQWKGNIRSHKLGDWNISRLLVSENTGASDGLGVWTTPPSRRGRRNVMKASDQQGEAARAKVSVIRVHRPRQFFISLLLFFPSFTEV